MARRGEASDEAEGAEGVCLRGYRAAGGMVEWLLAATSPRKGSGFYLPTRKEYRDIQFDAMASQLVARFYHPLGRTGKVASDARICEQLEHPCTALHVTQYSYTLMAPERA